MSDLGNPHDPFFKEAFSRPEVARDFLAQQLPPAVLVHALETALIDDKGETLMTTLAQQWLEQGRQEGKQQGLEQGLEQGLKAMRNSILDLLKIRFDTADLTLVQALEKIDDLDTLRIILAQAATADSIMLVEQAVATAVAEATVDEDNTADGP